MVALTKKWLALAKGQPINCHSLKLTENMHKIGCNVTLTDAVPQKQTNYSLN